jgi:predicted nucleotidyltransferase
MLRICARHGARSVRLFGAVVRGEAGADSEVDILVEFEADRGLWDRVALTQALEDLLGRKVEVVSEKGLQPHIRDRILEQAVPL